MTCKIIRYIWSRDGGTARPMPVQWGELGVTEAGQHLQTSDDDIGGENDGGNVGNCIQRSRRCLYQCCSGAYGCVSLCGGFYRWCDTKRPYAD